MEKTIELIWLEDGRKGKRVTSIDGNTKTVELYVEPELPKYLEKKIVEYKEPVIVKREVFDYNEDGQIIDSSIEHIEHPLEEKEEENVSALKNDEDNYVTRYDLKEALLRVVRILTKENVNVSASSIIEKKKNKKSSFVKFDFLWGIVIILIGILAYIILT